MVDSWIRPGTVYRIVILRVAVPVSCIDESAICGEIV